MTWPQSRATIPGPATGTGAVRRRLTSTWVLIQSASASRIDPDERRRRCSPEYRPADRGTARSAPTDRRRRRRGECSRFCPPARQLFMATRDRVDHNPFLTKAFDNRFPIPAEAPSPWPLYNLKMAYVPLLLRQSDLPLTLFSDCMQLCPMGIRHK